MKKFIYDTDSIESTLNNRCGESVEILEVFSDNSYKIQFQDGYETVVSENEIYGK